MVIITHYLLEQTIIVYTLGNMIHVLFWGFPLHQTYNIHGVF